MAGMPKERQTLFFSATLSPTIEKLIGEFLRIPIRVSVKKGDTAKNVDQDVVRIQKGENKFSVLYDLLTKKNFAKCLCSAAQKRSGEAVRNACGERHQGRVNPRQQKPCPAPASAGQVQRKSRPSFGGHRCGGARFGYRRHQPCHQLRHSPDIRRLCASHRPDRPRRQARQSAYIYRITLNCEITSFATPFAALSKVGKFSRKKLWSRAMMLFRNSCE